MTTTWTINGRSSNNRSSHLDTAKSDKQARPAHALPFVHALHSGPHAFALYGLSANASGRAHTANHSTTPYSPNTAWWSYGRYPSTVDNGNPLLYRPGLVKKTTQRDPRPGSSWLRCRDENGWVPREMITKRRHDHNPVIRNDTPSGMVNNDAHTLVQAMSVLGAPLAAGQSCWEDRQPTHVAPLIGSAR